MRSYLCEHSGERGALDAPACAEDERGAQRDVGNAAYSGALVSPSPRNTPCSMWPQTLVTTLMSEIREAQRDVGYAQARRRIQRCLAAQPPEQALQLKCNN